MNSTFRFIHVRVFAREIGAGRFGNTLERARTPYPLPPSARNRRALQTRRLQALRSRGFAICGNVDEPTNPITPPEPGAVTVGWGGGSPHRGSHGGAPEAVPELRTCIIGLFCTQRVSGAEEFTLLNRVLAYALPRARTSPWLPGAGRADFLPDAAEADRSTCSHPLGPSKGSASDHKHLPEERFRLRGSLVRK